MDEEIAEPGRKFLHSAIHCASCSKLALDPQDMANFIICFWDKFDPKSGDPLIRDGIFDENARIAVLKACPDCGPKIKRLSLGYKFDKPNQLAPLNDGPLKKMLAQIWPRRRSSWKLEIGWQIMIPLLQQMKEQTLSRQRMH